MVKLLERDVKMMKAIKMDARAIFYKENPKTKDFILKFFKVEHGLRCRVRHPFGEVYPIYRDNSRSVAYGGKYGYPLTDINEGNIEYELKNAATEHFLYYLFDEGIRECNSKAEIADHIIGLTCVMDVDSPYINTHSKEKVRYNVLGNKGERVMKMFDQLKGVAKKELVEVGYWDDTRVMFSGNGFYLIMPDFYGTKEEIAEHMNGFVGLEKFVNGVCRKEYGFTQDLCDERTIPWNRYCKIPFSFHAKYNRISMPLDKEANFVDGVKCNIVDWR